MATYSISAGTTSRPVKVDRGSIISVSVTDAVVQYTEQAESAISNNVASWSTMTLTNSAAYVTDDLWVRVVSTSAVVLTINANPSTESLKIYSADYRGSAAAVQSTVSGLVLDNSGGAASANTLRIQTALTAGGVVRVEDRGVVYINNTLVISSGTILSLSPGTTLRLAPSTNKAMLIPAAFQNYLTGASITIAWTAGAVATVTWTAHGLTTQDYVWVQGAAQSEFNNVFRVLQVVDANTFTITLFRQPTTTATGTITAIACTRDFVVQGGIWDYDIANNGGATNPNADIWMMVGAANFVCRDYVHLNYHRGVTSGAVANFLFSNGKYMSPATGVASEGHKTFGPANNGHLLKLDIKSNDDGASVQPREAPAFSWTGMPFGDIFGIVFEDCLARQQGNAAAGAFPVYCSDSEIIEDLRYVNCYGYSDQGTGFVVKYGNTFSTGKVGSLSIENCTFTTNTAASQFPISFAALVDQVKIDGLKLVPGNLANVMFNVGSASTIKVLSVSRMKVNLTTWPSSAQFVFNIAGTIDTLNFRDIVASGVSANFQFGATSGTANVINFENCDFQTMAKVWQVQTGGTTLCINARGVYVKSTSSFIEPRSTTTPTAITLNGCRFDTLSTGVIRPSTGTGLVCRIYGDGNTFNSAATVNATGSATFEIYSNNIAVDVGQTGAIKTTSGQFTLNTSAGGARGTLTASRLATCNATNWLQLDTPANTF